MKRFTSLKLWQKILIIVALLLVVLIALFLVWANQVFTAEADMKAKILDTVVVEQNDTRIVMKPVTANGIGIVFVPGAKVAADAYEYKLSGLVEKGYTVVITKPLLNLALFDQRSVSTFTDGVSGIRTWYAGGHSLGGVRACQMATENSIKGLILYGTYCINDVSKPVLSVRGSNDKLTAADDIKKNSSHTDNMMYHEITGADHAAIADYGAQPGDGPMQIDDVKMRAEFTDLVLMFAK